MSNSNGGDEQKVKPSSNNEKYIYWVVGVVVLVLIVWGIYAATHQSPSAITSNSQTPASQSVSNNATTTPTSTPVTASGASNSSYGAAIKAYPERFQFSQCQGTPATMSVRLGTPVMLDNRDAVAHTIKADTQSFRIAGYGYAIFHPAVIGNLVVTCDGKTRVTLNVEK